MDPETDRTTLEDGRTKPRVSGLVTCFNEEHNIGECIKSLLWCDEIIVVDSLSTDRTPEIAQSFEKVRFFQRTYFGAGASDIRGSFSSIRMRGAPPVFARRSRICSSMVRGTMPTPSTGTSTSSAGGSSTRVGSAIGWPGSLGPGPPTTRTAASTPCSIR